jgi:hypothetical protein
MYRSDFFSLTEAAQIARSSSSQQAGNAIEVTSIQTFQ